MGRSGKGCSKDTSTPKSPESMNATLFRKRVYADVIKLGTLRRDYAGLPRWVLNLMVNVPVKVKEEPREDGDWTDAASENVKSHQRWKKQEQIVPSTSRGGTALKTS